MTKSPKKTKQKKKKKVDIKSLSFRAYSIPLSLIAASFLIRMINLLKFPLFNDEAINLEWSKAVAANPLQNYNIVIRTTGQIPFYTWLCAVSFKFFSNPVFAGRFVTIVCGALSTLGIYLIGRFLFSEKVGIVASLFYIFLPETFFFDRIGYYDGPMNMFAIFILLFTTLFFVGNKKYYFLYFVGLGLSLGLVALTKFSAVILLPYPIIVWFFLREGFSKEQLKWIISGYIFSAISYYWLFSDPYSSIILTVGKAASPGIKDLLAFKFPLNFWINFIYIWRIWVAYLTVPLIALSAVGIFYLLKYKDKKDWLLFIAFFAPTLFFILVSAGSIPARYLFFTFFPLLVFLAKVAVDLCEKIKALFSRRVFLGKGKEIKSLLILAAFSFFLLLPSLRFDYFLYTDPVKASLAIFDRKTYIEFYASGYGLNEAVDYLKKESKKGLIVLALPHPDIAIIHSGPIVLLDNQSNVYPVKLSWNIFKKYLYPPEGYQNGLIPVNILGLLRPYLKGFERVLAVTPQETSASFLDANPGATLKWSYTRPGKRSGINIYELPYKK